MRRVPGTVALCLFLTGCGGDPATPAPAPEEAVAPAGPPPLAEAQTDRPPLHVRILEVTRATGSTLEVRFVFANTSLTEPVPFGHAFAADARDADTVADMFLLDTAGQRKYFVVRDADNLALCSRDLEPIEPGGEQLLWARFPAPPEDISRVNIHIPGVPPMEGVPIGDR